ncbi:F-box/LRR-repeat protein 5-like [Gigantopelta aegis]|uniref:F-box/LRR-repeat protein 5-like n=1 Tax=Gigantopelta aegis TaxID=1735272 RepID=UPI001B88E253|nr:F-box/LRR-repeat protein 5-like [Gigantopelta aegis]XP_041349077.1 F-box/LRR-repeat protein 5-like [Gigantopelta aegis]
MAPLWPEEVDVFSVPHLRMKELVQRYLDMMSSINFSDVVNLTTSLESLFNTFKMFKAHEQIENKYIMRRLREKLQALSITNRAVCNCHKDSKLSKMLSLLQQGHSMARTTDMERVNFGLKLRQALEDFTEQFLPHMEEEEEVFQPMLIEYFSYEELKEIKAKVIKKHLIQEQSELFTVEKCVEDALSSESSDEEAEVVSPRLGYNHLPYEVRLKIVSYLCPRDLGRCAQVCQGWNLLALDGSLWMDLYPVSWAKGIWTFEPPQIDDCDIEPENNHFVYDEDADIDESGTDSYFEQDQDLKQAYKEAHLLSSLVEGLLPRVGRFVKKCSLAFSTGLCSGMVHKFLRLCPNLEHLDFTHSAVSDVAFKGFGMDMCGKKLKYLNLTGCTKITDLTLQRLACALKLTASLSSPSDIEDVQRTNSNSCFHGNNSVIQDDIQPNEICLQDVHRNSSTAGTVIPCCSTNEQTTLSLVTVEIPSLGCSDVILLSNQTENCTPKRCCNCIRTTVCCKDARPLCVVSGRDKDLDGQMINLSVDNSGVPLTHGGLEFLSLSGCYQITDAGLRSLAESKNLLHLEYLNLSGCVDITADGLTTLVSGCTSLDHANLFYCDNLADDPYPATASSCQNLECSSRYCCRIGD